MIVQIRKPIMILIPLQLFQSPRRSKPYVARDLQSVSWLFHKGYLKHFLLVSASRYYETVAHA